jgi:1-acyl-sn-glycerol-3-phosphate acyltransferase
MGFLWSLVVVHPLIIASTVLHWFLATVSLKIGGSAQTLNRWEKAWANSLLKIAGVKLTIEGLERITPGGQYVFASNHLSYMDTPVVLGNIPVHFRFLAKSELFEIPVLGWHLRDGGHISVPLEDPRASLKTLSQAAKIIRDDGISILVFPEGGRSMDGELQEFKDGAAYLALKAQVPIVPVALVGIRKILPMGSFTFHRGPVTLKIGTPMETQGLTSHHRKELTEKIRVQIEAMLGPGEGAAMEATLKTARTSQTSR